jgi:ATP-dependent DNA helicase RecG
MIMSLTEFDELLRAPEDEHLEFKEARRSCSFDELAKYCTAIANEGGGKVALGVTNDRPRCVVGTTVFQ